MLPPSAPIKFVPVGCPFNSQPRREKSLRGTASALFSPEVDVLFDCDDSVHTTKEPNRSKCINPVIPLSFSFHSILIIIHSFPSISGIGSNTGLVWDTPPKPLHFGSPSPRRLNSNPPEPLYSQTPYSQTAEAFNPQPQTPNPETANPKPDRHVKVCEPQIPNSRTPNPLICNLSHRTY